MMQDLSPQQDIEMKSSLIAVSSCHTSRISLQKECNQEMGGRKSKAELGQGEGEPCAYPNYSSTVLTWLPTDFLPPFCGCAPAAAQGYLPLNFLLSPGPSASLWILLHFTQCWSTRGFSVCRVQTFLIHWKMVLTSKTQHPEACGQRGADVCQLLPLPEDLAVPTAPFRVCWDIRLACASTVHSLTHIFPLWPLSFCVCTLLVWILSRPF